MRIFLSTLGVGMVCVLNLAACQGSGAGGGGGVTDGAPQGLWMQKEFAQELRATGKVAQVCAETKADPKVQIIAVWRIDQFGAVYFYDSSSPQLGQVKLGVVEASGNFRLSDEFKKDAGPEALTLKVVGNELVLSAGGGIGGVIYVPTSVAEAKRFYDFEDTCRKP